MWKHMRLALLPAFFLAFAGTATAQDAECRTIESSTARLACYDKAAPPAAKAKSATPKGAKAADVDRPQDFLAVENARLDAALRNICRGC